MVNEFRMFGVGWEKCGFYGSSTFALDQDDNIFLIEEECGEIDLEQSCEDFTIFKDIWEIPIPISEAYSDDSMYNKSYRFVERHQEEIIDLVNSGCDYEDFGIYCVKIFSPRQLNLKG